MDSRRTGSLPRPLSGPPVASSGRPDSTSKRVRVTAVVLTVLLLVVASATALLPISGPAIQHAAAMDRVEAGVRQLAANSSSGAGDELAKLPPAAVAKIEPLLLRQMAEDGEATFIVYLRDRAELSAVTAIEKLDERRLAVFDTLRSTAQRSQRDILAFLRKQAEAGQAGDIVPFWIFNGVAVTGDAQTLAAVAARDDVVSVRANHVHHLPAPIQDSTDSPRPQTLLWNIERIRANIVWTELGITGQGVVVANMDTGVDWQHNALRDKYRGKDGDHNYNWFDLTGTYPQTPNDGHNHGTHTMGTIVGDGVDETGQRLQIGVAPGARWIAVKVFDDNGETTDLWIHQAFQWIAAPTDLSGENPDPTRAPDVVNNSWGSSNGADATFRPDIQALRAAGIVPVFSAGNTGDLGAGTIGSPGALPDSIAVGATEPDPIVASFSSQGPSFWEEMKPEFSAPGRSIRSAVAGNRYAVFSGTSMAAPHVTGSIALMLEAARSAAEKLAARDALPLDGTPLLRADPIPGIDDLEQLLALTAVDIGAPGPDNSAGAGRIDAYRATVWAMTAGKLYGFVRDGATGAPIAAATIAGTSLSNPEDRFTATSTDDGEYSVSVPEGRYAVEVSAFGHQALTIGNVEVIAGFLTLRDIQLDRLPTGTVAGQVRTVDGMPILATVEVVGTPVRTQTDGKGTYSLALPAGTHTLRVATAGYRTESAAVVVTVGERTVQTFVLSPAPSTLFVDADQWVGDNASLYYEFALNKAGIPFDTRPITDTESVPTAAELSAYDVVIWAQAWTSPGTIDQQREDTATVDALKGYLNHGGRLLLTGQDVGFLDGGGNPTNPVALPYFQDYLHARYTTGSVTRTSTIRGASDDIMAGIVLRFDTVYAYKRSERGFSPDGIEPADTAAQTILRYDDGTSAGIKVQAGNYRVVYLGFSADTTGEREDLADLFSRAYAWLSRPVLTKSVDKAQAGLGERLTYTISLENAVGSPLENVALVDRLPDGVEYVAGSATGGAWYTAEERTIEWFGSILPRDSTTFTFQVDLRGDLVGDSIVTNSATALVGEMQLEAAAATRVLGPNLTSSTKTVDKPRVSGGDEVTYTIRLVNSSPITATGASLVDPIPAGTRYVEGSVTGGATYDAGQQAIRWSGDVPAAAPLDQPYTWIDSDTTGGPTFAWDSRAEEQGRPVSGLADDTTSPEIAIGFTFPFFDEQFTTFRVSSNGFLSFTSSDAPFRNLPLPSENAPRNLIAPFWDDLTLASQGAVYTWSNNVDTLVVSWVAVPRFGGTEPYTFQAILRGDGEIVFQYQDLGSPVNSATIGIQNRDATAGLTIAYDEEYAHDGLAIVLLPPQPAIPPPVITFRVQVSEDVSAGSVITNTATVDDGHGQLLQLTASSRANIGDLTGSRKLAPAIALPGETLTYTVELINAGQITATATVTDPIPGGTQYRAGSATGGATYDGGTNSIRWAGQVPADGSHVVTFAVDVEPAIEIGTVITNTATVDDEFNPPTALVAATTIIQPDLSRSTKLVDRLEARSGDVLNYTIRVENSSAVEVSNIRVVDQLPAGLVFVPGSLSSNATFDPAENAIQWTGTLPARGEGYAWDDSDTEGGPLFAWDNRAETVGARIRDQWNLADDTNVGPFPVGFDFPFFDESFDQFYVSTNGFLSFNLITDRFFTNRRLPDTTAPGNMVAIFWDDLDLRPGGEIYYWSNDVDTLVVSWVGVPHLARGGPYTFQAVLRSDGTIMFHYLAMDPSRLAEATIGIQDAGGTDGLTVAHDESYVHDSLAVRIAPPTGKEQIQFQAQVADDVPVESIIVNAATIKDSLGNQIQREAKTRVNTIDLSAATMQAGAAQVVPGGRLSYRFTLPNAGTADATQAVVVNLLPPALSFVEGSATNGATYDPELREVRWEGTVPSGEHISFEYSADVLPPLADGDTIVNEATISDGVHPAIRRSASVQVVAPDLSRSEKRAAAMVGRGGTLVYLVRIVNSGHAPANVVFTDPLPAGITFVEGSAQASFGAPMQFAGATRTLTWAGVVPARGIVELRFSAVATGEVDSITNSASIDDGLDAVLMLSASTRVVPHRFVLPLILKHPAPGLQAGQP